MLFGLFGSKKPAAVMADAQAKAAYQAGFQRGVVHASYDAAARGNPDDRKHWANADCLSAEQANSPGVRQILRSRSRYEVANNSYANGMVRTKCNYLIGTGPRLQMQFEDRGVNARIERAFADWCREVGFSKKLRTMKRSKIVDGEAFAMLTTNPGLKTRVKLDIRLVEADMVSTPDLGFKPPAGVTDGIVFDQYGNPETYHVLKQHPGDGMSFAVDRSGKFDVPAASMIHLFDADRPGQIRGIPETMPALRLFAQLRRFTIAVLGAAEIAARMALVIQSDMPNGDQQPAEINAQEIPINGLQAVRIPEGWKMNGFKGEQPTTTYGEFKREILNEIARALNLPFNIAVGNSSSYNYSSGRLDQQSFYQDLNVERSDWNIDVLRRVFFAWLDEALLLPNYLDLPAGLPPYGEWPFEWFYDGLLHVDPLKEAAADDVRIQNYTLSLAEYYAKKGQNWEVAMRQIVKEQEFLRKNGLTIADVNPNGPVQQMIRQMMMEQEHAGHAKAA